MDDEAECIAYRIEDFGLSLSYPEHWQQRVEHGKTHLFWDEYTGSLRVTPTFPASEGFDVDAFLGRERERTDGATFRQIGNLRFLCYIEDSGDDDVTRNHHYVTGRGDVLVVCTWSYARSLLDEALSADEVEGEKENAEAVLASLAFG